MAESWSTDQYQRILFVCWGLMCMNSVRGCWRTSHKSYVLRIQVKAMQPHISLRLHHHHICVQNVVKTRKALSRVHTSAKENSPTLTFKLYSLLNTPDSLKTKARGLFPQKSTKLWENIAVSSWIRADVAKGKSQRLVIGMLLVWFPCSASWSVLGQDTQPQTAPDVLVSTLHGSHRHQCTNVCMNYSKSHWIKVSDRWP